METISEMLRARTRDERPGLVAGDSQWSWADVVRLSRARAGLAAALLSGGPPHICVLLDNVPEFCFWLGASALGGSVLVGGNPNHRGDELARDIAHTECQVLVTDLAHLPLVEGLDLGPGIGRPDSDNPRVLVIDSPGYE
jgi:fatty-acyl-CoA synthase